MASEPKAELKIVFGAMALGKKSDKHSARVHSLSDCAAMLDIFQRHGHSEIDTARIYGGGSSEEYLGQLDWQQRGLVIDTKLSPIKRPAGEKSYSHRPTDLREAVIDSMAALKTDRVDTWYLHAPDRATPYEDTLRGVDELYREGRFNRFGISNYPAWEVAQICEICIRHGWKQPDVYQGAYNALHRAVEPELFPCLRKYGIAFYAFNPVAGGMLTDRYDRDTEIIEPGSRFDPAKRQGLTYRRRYWKDAYFDALDVIRPAAKRHGISTAEAALRWITHHSQLKREFGDAVIIGASSAAQLEENLDSLEKGPLSEELVEAFDQGWAFVKGVCAPYFH